MPHAKSGDLAIYSTTHRPRRQRLGSSSSRAFIPATAVPCTVGASRRRSRSRRRSAMRWGIAAAVASAAAIAVASGAELLACDCAPPAAAVVVGRCDGFLFRQQGSASRGKGSAAGGDKFAPRFDGLRFIETLVTAHR